MSESIDNTASTFWFHTNIVVLRDSNNVITNVYTSIFHVWSISWVLAYSRLMYGISTAAANRITVINKFGFSQIVINKNKITKRDLRKKFSLPILPFLFSIFVVKKLMLIIDK